MTDILAIDLATTTGWARGRVGDHAPTFGTAKFGGKDRGDVNIVFSNAMRWFMEKIIDNVPDVIIVESLLPPSAMSGETSTAVRDRLAGLHGVMRAVAKREHVGEISQVSVGTVRQHFLGTRGLRRDMAKTATMERCKSLGWAIKNDNEADACAIWSFAVSTVDPSQALRVSPLFNKALRMTVQ